MQHSADREFAMCSGSHMAIAQLCKTGCLFPHNSKLGCAVRNINDRMTESTALFQRVSDVQAYITFHLQ